MSTEDGDEKTDADTYLLVCESQLVLEDGFAVDQTLHLVGQCIEGLDQSLGQLLLMLHVMPEIATRLRLVPAAQSAD